VVLDSKLLHWIFTTAHGIVKGSCGHLSGLMGTQLCQLCVLAMLTYLFHLPTIIYGTCDIAGCVQKSFKNQPVQPVVIYVSVMIAIALLLWLISSLRKAWLISSIRKLLYFKYFKSVFLQLQECTYMEGFHNQVTYNKAPMHSPHFDEIWFWLYHMLMRYGSGYKYWPNANFNFNM